MVNFSKIDLIKIFRTSTGASLVDSKYAVEFFLSAFHIGEPVNYSYSFDSVDVSDFVKFVSLFSKGYLCMDGPSIKPAMPEALSEGQVVARVKGN